MADPLHMADERYWRCWRCILLDQPCDDDGIVCELCENDKQQYPYIQCKKGDIVDVDAFNSRFAGVYKSEDGIWHLKGRGQYVKIRIDYTEITAEDLRTSVILDVPRCAEVHSSPDLRSSVVTFLRQFSTLKQRWSLLYETFVEDMLGSFAMYQEQRLVNAPTDLQSPIQNPMLITSALRCLVTAQELANVSYCWPPGLLGLNDLDFHGWLEDASKDENRGGYSPGIYLWRLPKDAEFPPRNAEQPFQSLILDTVQSAHKVLLRGDPRDWPYVFAALCILSLIQHDLQVTSDFTDALAAPTQGLRSYIGALSTVFLLCVKEHNPLTLEFDIENYALLVDDDAEAVKMFEWISNEWKESTTVEYDEDLNDVDVFVDKMDELVSGFIRF